MSGVFAGLLVGLFYVLEDLERQWSGRSGILLVLGVFYGWSTWKFLRNRVGEWRLLRNGEMAIGHILEKGSTRYSAYVIYEFRDQTEQSFQKRETDFFDGLFEGMPVHVFYDRESKKSVALEGALFRLKQ